MQVHEIETTLLIGERFGELRACYGIDVTGHHADSVSVHVTIEEGVTVPLSYLREALEPLLAIIRPGGFLHAYFRRWPDMTLTIRAPAAPADVVAMADQRARRAGL